MSFNTTTGLQTAGMLHTITFWYHPQIIIKPHPGIDSVRIYHYAGVMLLSAQSFYRAMELDTLLLIPFIHISIPADLREVRFKLTHPTSNSTIDDRYQLSPSLFIVLKYIAHFT